MALLKDMTDWERMVADYGLLGLSPSFHPLGLLRRRLPSDVLTATALRSAGNGRRVRTAGLVVCRQRPKTASGFLFILLEDETGLTNVVVRPNLYEAERSTVRGQPYLCVEGTIQLRSNTLNLLAEHTLPLAQVPGVLMPQPLVDEPEEINESDEEAIEPAAAVTAAGTVLKDLDLATPASHDFR